MSMPNFRRSEAAEVLVLWPKNISRKQLSAVLLPCMILPQPLPRWFPGTRSPAYLPKPCPGFFNLLAAHLCGNGCMPGFIRLEYLPAAEIFDPVHLSDVRISGIRQT